MLVIDGVEMVDVREAARLTGRTAETVRRWVWSGRLESTRSGRKILVPRAALDAVTTGDGSARPTTSLAEWAATLPRERRGRKGTSARDLVAQERARRAGR